MSQDENIAQIRQRYLFKRSVLELLREMEWVVPVTFQETTAAEPDRSITIQASILALFQYARLAGNIRGWNFMVKNMCGILTLVV
jgi:hypothetical protein